MDIIWKDIIGYEGLYQVSNTGLVKSLSREITQNLRGKIGKKRQLNERLLKYDLNKDGYKVIKLCKQSVAVHRCIHRLVGIHFVPNPTNLQVLNHKDADKLNCNDWNLEWCTTQYNTEHARKKGLLKGNGGLRGATAPYKKLTEQQVIEIRTNYTKKDNYQIIGKKYNVTGKNISHIMLGQTWKHLII